jgi:hypothetical protein
MKNKGIIKGCTTGLTNWHAAIFSGISNWIPARLAVCAGFDGIQPARIQSSFILVLWHYDRKSTSPGIKAPLSRDQAIKSILALKALAFH